MAISVVPPTPVTLGSVSAAAAAPAPTATGFSTMLSHAVTQLTSVQAGAEQAITAAMGGQGSITQVMLAMNKAQMTLDMATSMQSQAVQSYRTIMNMPLG